MITAANGVLRCNKTIFELCAAWTAVDRRVQALIVLPMDQVDRDVWAMYSWNSQECYTAAGVYIQSRAPRELWKFA